MQINVQWQKVSNANKWLDGEQGWSGTWISKQSGDFSFANTKANKHTEQVGTTADHLQAYTTEQSR